VSPTRQYASLVLRNLSHASITGQTDANHEAIILLLIDDQTEADIKAKSKFLTN